MPNDLERISQLVELGNSLAQRTNTQPTTQVNEGGQLNVDYKKVAQFLEYEILEFYAKNKDNPLVVEFVSNLTNKAKQNLID
jgi:hypothetical protein|tara:strand:+ start:760 stop:1005 length:246 start_codon:yes stop_codon:yes gene_type:complete